MEGVEVTSVSGRWEAVGRKHILELPVMFLDQFASTMQYQG